MNKEDNVIDLNINNNDIPITKTNISSTTTTLDQPTANHHHSESEVKVVQSFEIANDDTNYINDDFVYGNHISISKPLHLGKLICLCYIFGHPIIVLGKEKHNLNRSLLKANEILYSVLFICHMWIFLINPGIPSRKLHPKAFKQTQTYQKLTEREKEDYGYCEICHIIREPYSDIEHCEDCDICVRKYDHHCVWTGKCITRYNIMAFYLFSVGSFFYILLYFLTVLFCLISRSKQKKE